MKEVIPSGMRAHTSSSGQDSGLFPGYSVFRLAYCSIQGLNSYLGAVGWCGWIDLSRLSLNSFTSKRREASWIMLSEPTHPTEEDQTNNTKEERVPLYRVKALYDYSPQEIDELPLRRNQLLEVLSLEEDPW